MQLSINKKLSVHKICILYGDKTKCRETKRRRRKRRRTKCRVNIMSDEQNVGQGKRRGENVGSENVG